ncbi:PQQ-binding-like beta-propeller repeat protein [Nocardiopsis sp. JB363]|uniref:outer membrane protein assembly factor BamB family protein n=1 Tax=Nocardiopsis sp. JB363 TaxID=1434837 RepID=UPI001F2E88C5|nr:PQQ-binding-like beta-propeller repeat protein [Nocardiopsis sp. JB363]
MVLFETGAVALSGETGEELWSYHDRSREFIGNVASGGEYVVLYDQEESQVVLFESDTGRIAYEYTQELTGIDYTHDSSFGHLRPAMAGITDDTWIVRWEDSASSYDLSTGERLWSVSNVPNCSDVGQVDDLTVRKDVVVAATTCFEHPEDEETVAWTVGWDFTSELVGLSPETGEELWRVEHTIGRMPIDSLERTISSRPGGLIYVNYPESHDLGISLLDIDTGEVRYSDAQSLLWTSRDGSRLGLWDTETGEYRVQDRSGSVERTLERDGVSMSEDMVVDGHKVGLEDGVLYLNEWTEDASASEGFGRFDGFDGDSTFVWDKAEELSVHEALDVPGAVAVSYTADGEPGVMGLR